MKMPSRLDTSLLARWWWSVDQLSLGIIACIMFIGVVLIMAAGPVAASRLSHVSDFHFPLRQLIFLGPALFIMLSVSMLTPLQVRRAGVVLFVMSVLLMLTVLLIGDEINGAKRWLDMGPTFLQPSEFAKTGFVIAAAWMLAEGSRDSSFPGGMIALGLYFVMSGLLIAQPDIGQWVLLTGVWAVMFFIAGWNMVWLFLLAGTGAGALMAGYLFLPHHLDHLGLVK